MTENILSRRRVIWNTNNEVGKQDTIWIIGKIDRTSERNLLFLSVVDRTILSL